jgi:sensor histidine kinase regulating citrate/malate metabolism
MQGAFALKIAVFLFFVVAAVTLVLRKHFYMSLGNTKTQELHIPLKTANKIEKAEFLIEALEEEKNDDGLKIKIEKEIR